MNWFQFGVQWLHVLFAIGWFGSVIGIGVVTMPIVMKMGPANMREFFQGFDQRQKIPTAFGVMTVALGIIRGTLLGPIKSVSFLLGTAYGKTWLVALAAALFSLAFPFFVIEPRMKRMLAADQLWQPGPGGGRSAELDLTMRSLNRTAPLGMVGMLVAFTCMILMRFGL